jgi:hypothetical protein
MTLPIERPDLDALERLHEATGNYIWFYEGVDEVMPKLIAYCRYLESLVSR